MILAMSGKKIVLLAMGFLLVLGIYQYSRPLPVVQPKVNFSQPKTSPTVNLPWPAYGQGALGAQGYGLLETHGQQKAAPMASITKVVTALAVLKQKPLAVGEHGPTITISSDDVAIYNSYYTQGGSVVKVEAGEQISEYQALQALLIPSANNMADTLVVWAFGSMENYITYANQMLQGLSLSQTKVVDASGILPQSTSTSADLVSLGLTVMESPVLADIVSQETANLPVASSVNNVNWLLGSDGVIGIKTGNTDVAGGCFLFAAKRIVNGQNIKLVGALMQAPDLNTVIKNARAVIVASDSGFESVKVASKGQTIGTYKAPWGGSTNAVAGQDLNILAWRGNKLQTNAKLDKLKTPAKAGTLAGSVSVTSDQKTSSIPVILKSNLSGPPWHWRFWR